MSYTLLKNGLNQIDKVVEWSLFLIHYEHKAYPNEYECYPVYFEPASLIATIVSRQKSTFEKIIEAYDGKVVKYTGFNPKGFIDKIDMADELVKDQWSSLLVHIQDCNDSKNLKKWMHQHTFLLDSIKTVMVRMQIYIY